MGKRLLIIFIVLPALLKAENGYDLWLRYKKISNTALLDRYKKQIISPVVLGSSQTIAIIKSELAQAFSGLTGTSYKILSSPGKSSVFIAGTVSTSTIISSIVTKDEMSRIESEGFIIKTRPGKTIITANTDIGVMYGVFHFLRLMQTRQSISNLNIISAPKIKLRILNHWDNLNRTVERGYAGFSIWDWHKLPDLIDKRYIDYARANASIGINSTVLTNVNANAVVLTKPYLEKVKALADLFRPYGIKVYLTARFSAPIEIGKLKSADPLNDTVQLWWKQKVKEVYELIPDFGGFLVKANSEGQPGPQDYQRTHADGANMLADAVAPYNGVVMWRAFVYSPDNNDDRVKQAVTEFAPLDGKFRDNVIVQIKNGPLDFMPREPFSPLFGAMPKTRLAAELQITQEYLGQSLQLAYLAPLWKEVLDTDVNGPARGAESNSTVASVIDGSAKLQHPSVIAGVANTGTDRNWTGHLLAQANWYAFGRLAWDHALSSEQIADEWTRLTFGHDATLVATIDKMLLGSRETVVNYSMP